MTLVALLTLPSHAVTIIGTYPGNTTSQSFGNPDTATYGQTFVVPVADNALNSFQFSLLVDSEFDFQFFVMDWDGTKATGSVLYESASTLSGGPRGPYDYTFSPNLALTSGNDYVAFWSVSKLFGPPDGRSEQPIRNDNPYANGNFVYMNHESDFSRLTSDQWGSLPSDDVAFRAVFAAQAVPDLSHTFPLLALGLAGLIFARTKLPV